MNSAVDLSQAVDLSALIDKSAQEKATQIPTPAGYKILCALPEMDEAYESGIIKADQTKKFEEALATVYFVVKLGPDCYTDKERYPSGPWCKEGDFVLVRPSSGTRIKIHGREFRVINEDTVEGVVQDPRGISRA